MKPEFTRRRFMMGAAGAAAGAMIGGCKPGTARPAVGEKSAGPAALADGAPAQSTYVEGSDGTFPYLEVSGTPREIGRAAGQRFGDLIRKGLDRRAQWFQSLRDFARGGGSEAVDILSAAARKHTPRAHDELVGWSEGSGVPLDDLMVLNLKTELAELMRVEQKPVESTDQVHPGCSTVVVARPDGFVHVHNEDGHDAYADLMFVLHARLTDGVGYLCLSYPGILPGNAPGINAHGVIQTTNFIGAREVRLGVGRYFLDRMIYEAKDLDEALGWATHPDRAFAFHHVLSSVAEKRAVSVEVTPSLKKVVDIDGLFLHTNHLILEGMQDQEQDEQYVSSSSTTRLEVLDAWSKSVEDPASLDVAQVVAALSSHEGKPYSPCRHPEGDVHGFTLATAAFQSSAGTMRLYRNQPCLGRWVDYDPPRPGSA